MCVDDLVCVCGLVLVCLLFCCVNNYVVLFVCYLFVLVRLVLV